MSSLTVGMVSLNEWTRRPQRRPMDCRHYTIGRGALGERRGVNRPVLDRSTDPTDPTDPTRTTAFRLPHFLLVPKLGLGTQVREALLRTVTGPTDPTGTDRLPNAECRLPNGDFPYSPTFDHRLRIRRCSRPGDSV